MKKYNCMGCHPVQVGQSSVLSTLPRYQDPDWKDQLPPTLIQEGARVNPEWLARFLANPADQPEGHESQRRPQVPASANADIQLLAERDPDAGAVLRSARPDSPRRTWRSSWSR